MEAIHVIAITRDGRTADSTCVFTREEGGTIAFGETVHNVGRQVNLGDDAVVPAEDAFDEAEHAARSQCQPDIAGLADRGLVEGWLSTWAG